MNAQWRLAARPVGLPKSSDWEWVQEPAPEAADGQFRVELEYLSLVSRRVFRGSLLAQRRTMQFGSGIEFAEHREYSAGDDLRYVWRSLPLNDVHPHAQMAAEAAEAAAAQGPFWEMHDQLLDHQDALTPLDLGRYAENLGLDIEELGRADGLAMAHTGENAAGIALNLHPSATAVTLLTAPKLAIHEVKGDVQSGWQTL